MNPAIAILVGLFMVFVLLPVVTSAFFGYRAGERLAICIGAISGLVLLMSCGLLAYIAHFPPLSGEDNRLAMAASVFTGVPALCTFLGNLGGYIAMGFLGSKQE
jgi:hypothetical protein